MARLLVVMPTHASESIPELHVHILNFFAKYNPDTEQVFLNAMAKIRDIAVEILDHEYRQRTGHAPRYFGGDDLEPEINQLLVDLFQNHYGLIARSGAFKLINHYQGNAPLLEDLLHSMSINPENAPDCHAAYVVIAHLVGLVHAWQSSQILAPQITWYAHPALMGINIVMSMSTVTVTYLVEAARMISARAARFFYR